MQRLASFLSQHVLDSNSWVPDSCGLIQRPTRVLYEFLLPDVETQDSDCRKLIESIEDRKDDLGMRRSLGTIRAL